MFKVSTSPPSNLEKDGIKAAAIHGNKSQGARERALKGFKNRTIRILVATDIASRGIDVDKLSHVINYEIPEQAETYVHRIGRTGRAGASGVAMSFCAREEITYLKDINKLIKKNIEVVSTHPFEEAGASAEVNHDTKTVNKQINNPVKKSRNRFHQKTKQNEKRSSKIF